MRMRKIFSWLIVAMMFAGVLFAGPPGVNASVGGRLSCNPYVTPNFTIYYGYVYIGSKPAPSGTLVEFVTPRGEVAGCTFVDPDRIGNGIMKFTFAYGKYFSTEPGFLSGEPVMVLVNKKPARMSPAQVWQNDWEATMAKIVQDTFSRKAPRLPLPIAPLAR